LTITHGIAKFLAQPSGEVSQLLNATPLFTPYTIRKITENGQFSYAKAAKELGYAPRPAREALQAQLQWIREND
jgi:dihydroflavonol-4-reductase